MDVQGRAARSRAAWRWRTASSTSGPTAATSTRSRQRTRQAGLARGHQRRQLRPAGGQLLRHARPSPTGACTSATPTATCTRSRRQRQAGLAARDGLLRLRLAGRGPGARQQADRLLRVLRRDLLRARRPHRRHPLDATATAARSPAPPPWSATSSTTRTGASATRPGLWARSGKRAWHSTRGAFNPVVSDGQVVYVTGFSSVGAFMPKTAAEERATAARQAKKAAKAKAAKKRKAARRRRPRRRRSARRPRPRSGRPRRSGARRNNNVSGGAGERA